MLLYCFYIIICHFARSPAPLYYYRGDGFVTDGDLIRNLRLDDPRPFFKELLTKMYRKRTVLSPHFYGMTVTNNTHTGHALWEKFTQSWGKLQVGVGVV